MKVKSNLLSDYEIDGVVFSVTAKITECDDKLKNNFFFKALVKNGSFEIVEEKQQETRKR